MIRRPPRSTRTDTLVPYTTLFRSRLHPFDCGQSRVGDSPTGLPARAVHAAERLKCQLRRPKVVGRQSLQQRPCVVREARQPRLWVRSEEHTSELQSLMRISYAVFCLKKKTKT